MDQILSLPRRMHNLENLTLYLREKGGNSIIDGDFVQNEILLYMPQLHSFTFYISTYIDTRNLSHQLPQEDLSVGRGNPISMVNYVSPYAVVCSMFSLPLLLDFLADLGNRFPDVVFRNVTYLFVRSLEAFGHEFFVRIARSFPLLNCLWIGNGEPQPIRDPLGSSSDHPQSHSTIEYPHLTSLDMSYSHKDYLEQFLHEEKAYIPCLIKLSVSHDYLKIVTENFTREATRRNCAKVKQLDFFRPLNHPEDYSHYFPSL